VAGALPRAPAVAAAGGAPGHRRPTLPATAQPRLDPAAGET